MIKDFESYRDIENLHCCYLMVIHGTVGNDRSLGFVNDARVFSRLTPLPMNIGYAIKQSEFLFGVKTQLAKNSTSSRYISVK